MKRYEFSKLYRGQQIFLLFWAKSDLEAAKILDVSIYQIKTYCYKMTEGDYFEGIYGYFDSGNLYNVERNLIRKLMPLEELISLIDKHKYKEYTNFKESINHTSNCCATGNTGEENESNTCTSRSSRLRTQKNHC